MRDLKFPDQGLNLCPRHWKHGVLTTGSPHLLFQVHARLVPPPLTPNYATANCQMSHF